MVTSLSYMHRHVGECVAQVHRTHAEKQEFFNQHQLPNLTWMDWNCATHAKSWRFHMDLSQHGFPQSRCFFVFVFL
ncbi:unnamed protein product [Effrenium voratum]|nr:unnamed protein product [Effrenium voratum]